MIILEITGCSDREGEALAELARLLAKVTGHLRRRARLYDLDTPYPIHGSFHTCTGAVVFDVRPESLVDGKAEEDD